MAGVGMGGILLLPLVLAVCSSPVPRPVSENVASPRPEGRATAAVKTAPADSAPRAEVGRAEVARVAKVQRVEDLPPATPVAYRPLRVEELPQALAVGGRSRRGKGASAVQPLRVEDLPSVSAAVRPLRPDELNPELVKRADDLLWNHPSPIGVDIPLELDGKSYIARFALHYHEFGSAQKPWGYHKGVTLYSTAE